MYKQQMMRKLDNILNNSNVNQEDHIWIEAMMIQGLDAMKDRDELQWELENKMD